MEDLWNYAEKVAAEELKDKHPTSFAPTDPASVQQTIDQLNAALKDKVVDKKIKQKYPASQSNRHPYFSQALWKILNNSCPQRDQNKKNRLNYF